MGEKPLPGADASEEIEVTSEMIKAGMSALARHDPEFYSYEEIVCSVYRAMIAARGRAS